MSPSTWPLSPLLPSGEPLGGLEPGGLGHWELYAIWGPVEAGHISLASGCLESAAGTQFREVLLEVIKSEWDGLWSPLHQRVGTWAAMFCIDFYSVNNILSSHGISHEICIWFCLALFLFVDPADKFTLILQGWFIGMTTIMWLLKCQWNNSKAQVSHHDTSM